MSEFTPIPYSALIDSPESRDINFIITPVYSIGVVIILDDEILDIVPSVSLLDGVIVGVGNIVTASFTSSSASVPIIQEVITTNNFEIPTGGPVTFPSLVPGIPISYLPSLEELIFVNIGVSQNTVTTIINKNNTRSLINSATNNYRSRTSFRSGILIRN
jgi:hypothetical protein